MEEAPLQLSEAVTISVERMIRFCYLAQMTLELGERRSENDGAASFPSLPEHLTRFGMLLTMTCSFLYSLFERRSDSTNLLRIWTDFEHPFRQELEDIAERLGPFMGDLYRVRSRYDFHGSLTQDHQAAGFGIFQDPQFRELCQIIHAMKQLAVNMVMWFMRHGPAEVAACIPAFRAELLGPEGDVQ